MFVLENVSSLVIGIFILILLVMSILMPFFVFQIRDYTLKIKKEIITLNDNIIVIAKNSAILVEIQQGGALSQCSWCQKTFPSSQAEISKDVTLCPDCVKKNRLKRR